MKKINDVKRKRILKAVSAFAAVIIWIFVTQTENPTMDYTVKKIDISIKNENYLDNKGLVITNKDEIGEASVVIRGRRRDLINVLDSIEASVNVADIQEPGEYRIKAEYDIPNNTVDIAKRKTNTVLVKVSAIEEKEIDVKVIQTGKADNESYIVESVLDTEKILIKGADEDIKKIDHASVYIDVSQMSETNEDIYNIVCENANGETIKVPDEVIIGQDTVGVINNVYEKITLDVNVTIPNELNGYEVNILTTNREKVAVGLKSADISGISALSAILKVDEIVTGTGNYKAEINVPDGIYLDPKTKEVELSVEIIEKAEKIVTLPIKVKNAKKKGYTLLQENVQVKLSGDKQKLKAENVEAYIDLSKVKGTGKKTVYVQFETKTDGIKTDGTEVGVDIVIE